MDIEKCATYIGREYDEIAAHNANGTVATAAATVLGMSWNFRSRKISAPSSANCRTASGPSAVNSWLPTLKRAASPTSRWTRLRAG